MEVQETWPLTAFSETFVFAPFASLASLTTFLITGNLWVDRKSEMTSSFVEVSVMHTKEKDSRSRRTPPRFSFGVHGYGR